MPPRAPRSTRPASCWTTSPTRRSRARYKVYLIDEVHMFSAHSFNALLKTLEEPPPHVKFLLATTDPQKVPVTVLSRCLQFNLKRLLPERDRRPARAYPAARRYRVRAQALALLARAADGSMRDGLSLLDQAIAFGGGRVVADETCAPCSARVSGDLVLEPARGAGGRRRAAAAGARSIGSVPAHARTSASVLQELIGAAASRRAWRSRCRRRCPRTMPRTRAICALAAGWPRGRAALLSDRSARAAGPAAGPGPARRDWRWSCCACWPSGRRGASGRARRDWRCRQPSAAAARAGRRSTRRRRPAAAASAVRRRPASADPAGAGPGLTSSASAGANKHHRHRMRRLPRERAPDRVHGPAEHSGCWHAESWRTGCRVAAAGSWRATVPLTACGKRPTAAGLVLDPGSARRACLTEQLRKRVCEMRSPNTSAHDDT